MRLRSLSPLPSDQISSTTDQGDKFHLLILSAQHISPLNSLIIHLYTLPPPFWLRRSRQEQIESSNHRKLCRPRRSHQAAIWNVNFNHFLDLSICRGLGDRPPVEEMVIRERGSLAALDPSPSPSPCCNRNTLFFTLFRPTRRSRCGGRGDRYSILVGRASLKMGR